MFVVRFLLHRIAFSDACDDNDEDIERLWGVDLDAAQIAHVPQPPKSDHHQFPIDVGVVPARHLLFAEEETSIISFFEPDVPVLLMSNCCLAQGFSVTFVPLESLATDIDACSNPCFRGPLVSWALFAMPQLAGHGLLQV